MDHEIRELGVYAQKIAVVARDLGLDFYPVHFEVCPAETLYTFGAYGMPVRFTHWSFGKSFYRLKMQYDLNLSRIYELVINSNPSYAFLLEGNSLVQNKLVIGHVYAHVDFFKHNHYFQRTPQDMVERMGAHAEQIRKYELIHGREKVEQVLDAVLSIQEHVDFRAHLAQRKEKDSRVPSKKYLNSLYEDLWEEESPQENLENKREHEDLLLFIMEHSSILEEWERDIISMIREESLYFFPQIETKIINEGWATFWHSRIMHELDLSDEEVMDFAMMHSQVVQPSRLSLNPYYLGVKIWEELAEKNDMEYLFDVRETENDVSFIRNHLDRELIDKLNLFNFRKIGAHWQVTDTDWEKVRDNLVQQLVNGGHPKIVVTDGDYEGKRILYLRHAHEGMDLDIVYLEKTLLLVQKLWGRIAVLETVIDGKKVLFECQNGSVSRKHLSRQANE
ncbi:SpoVR family protein [Desulfitobacterium metallireducens]|uniref:Stage V sporulation protein R n=1 Tax=Desulfitobacterium metallireducens DSM 15288 TaxID=871968 RepID=W0E7K8_9FIRM|nr:SpoVR family protein [Desulfitobacterium metallireducens]AHF06747.1 stage V sporulation protein R [Desulfitobacterium metallireducens DSM 15288]